MRKRKKNSHRMNTEALLITMTSLAMNAPSSYTVAWSLPQNPKMAGILFAGLGATGLTAYGAYTHKRKIMWTGFVASMAVFGYALAVGVSQILQAKKQ